MEFTQPQRSWLVRTTAADSFPPLDPEMFGCKEQPWKVNFDKHIAEARELEESKAETDKYFRSIFDKQNAKARELEESNAKDAKESSKDA